MAKVVNEALGLGGQRQCAVVAIGNFDGVHLGHQEVLSQARSMAQEQNIPLAVLTFEPHPRQFFAPDAPDFRLMTAQSRAEFLKAHAADIVCDMPFNQEFSSLSAQEFIEQVIVQKMGASHVFVGEDFRFGAGRSGDVALLSEMGAALGFGVSVATLVDKNNHELSSSAIRAALRRGEPEKAAAMLGRAHLIRGDVIHGEKRGRELGFPTANLSLQGCLVPKHGVYATRVSVLTGPHQGAYVGATSIGVRPMFGVHHPNCETYIFDFKGDLYGERIGVELMSYLRPELTFSTLEDLIAQMGKDCDQVRALFEGGTERVGTYEAKLDD